MRVIILIHDEVAKEKFSRDVYNFLKDKCFLDNLSRLDSDGAEIKFCRYRQLTVDLLNRVKRDSFYLDCVGGILVLGKPSDIETDVIEAMNVNHRVQFRFDCADYAVFVRQDTLLVCETPIRLKLAFSATGIRWIEE